jgi:hypothetical protein
MYKEIFLNIFGWMFIIGFLGMMLKAGINREREKAFFENGIKDVIYFSGKVTLIEIISLFSFSMGGIGAVIVSFF